MTFDPTVRAAIIGCGAAGRARIRAALADFRNTSIEVVCEPSPEAYREAAAIFEAEGRPVPVNVPDLERLLGEHAHKLDVAFIVTPHALHFSSVLHSMDRPATPAWRPAWTCCWRSQW